MEEDFPLKVTAFRTKFSICSCSFSRHFKDAPKACSAFASDKVSLLMAMRNALIRSFVVFVVEGSDGAAVSLRFDEDDDDDDDFDFDAWEERVVRSSRSRGT